MNGELELSTPWTLADDLEGTSPEIEILCRFDLYHDGDWQQAPRAALVALENGLPVPEWTCPEVKNAIRVACGLSVPPRPRGPRNQGWKTRMSQQLRMAAWDAAEMCGYRGEKRLQVACALVNAQGVPTAPDTLKDTYKKRHRLRTLPSYPLMVFMCIDEILAQEQ